MAKPVERKPLTPLPDDVAARIGAVINDAAGSEPLKRLMLLRQIEAWISGEEYAAARAAKDGGASWDQLAEASARSRGNASEVYAADREKVRGQVYERHQKRLKTAAEPAEDPPGLSVLEFAKAVEVSEMTVRARIGDGSLKTVKAGRGLRVLTPPAEWPGRKR